MKISNKDIYCLVASIAIIITFGFAYFYNKKTGNLKEYYYQEMIKLCKCYDYAGKYEPEGLKIIDKETIKLSEEMHKNGFSYDEMAEMSNKACKLFYEFAWKRTGDSR